VEVNKLMRKKDLVIFSLFIVPILFLAGCQTTVGGISNTRTSDSQGIRYKLVSPSNQDTSTVTLRSNLNNNCDPPIGTFAYGTLNGVSNTCLTVLGCIQINAQATSTGDSRIRVNSVQPLLAVGVYGKDVTKCLAPDVVIIPYDRPLIDTGLSGF